MDEVEDVPVEVQGGLRRVDRRFDEVMWDSAQYAGDTSNGIVLNMLRSSSESRSFAVNTFYSPKLGESGAYFAGHHQGSSTLQIMSLPSNVGSDISDAITHCFPLVTAV